MGEVVYTSEVTLRRNHGPDRTAWLPAGEEVGFGAHGPIAAHYGVDEPDDPTSATLDYMVAAAGG